MPGAPVREPHQQPPKLLGSGTGHLFAGEQGSELTATSPNARAHPEAAQPPVLSCVPTTAGTLATGDTAGDKVRSERLSSHNLPG